MRGVFFDHPACLEHDPSAHIEAHPDTPERLLAIERELGSRDWLGWERRSAPAAGEDLLELVHAERHVRAIRELCEAGGGQIDPDTAVGEASYLAALHAAGAGAEMVRALSGGTAQAGFCGVRPSGHHAEPGRAMGFCLFNNVAIAAEVAIGECGARRVFVLDWDVHHGNGTAEAFRYRRDVLFASIHQANLFPGTGPRGDTGSGEGDGYTINLPVPAGSDEDQWLGLLDRIVLPAARAFEPEMILVSAGFDAHYADPLAGALLQTSSFAKMARRVRALGRTVGAPVGAVLEGGYEPDVLAGCVAATMQALGEEPAREEPA